MCVCIWERNMEKKYLASKRLIPSFSVQRQLLLYGYFKESGSRIQHKSPWQYKIEQADWSILCKLLAGTEMTKLSQLPVLLKMRYFALWKPEMKDEAKMYCNIPATLFKVRNKRMLALSQVLLIVLSSLISVLVIWKHRKCMPLQCV